MTLIFPLQFFYLRVNPLPAVSITSRRRAPWAASVVREFFTSVARSHSSASPRDAQVGEDGEHTAVIVVAGGEIELGEDVGDVLLDRAGRDDEALGDRRVRAPLGHQLEHVAL